MSQTNFLIGRGELLTHDIVGPKRMFGKAEVYTFAQARELLVPQFCSTAKALDELPPDACPGDFAVARLMMNPSFIARSYFPTGLLRSTGLEPIGSRTVKVKPQAWTRKGQPQETTTTELFVAGKRQAFRNLSQWTETIDAQSDEGEDLAHIEKFAAFAPAERIVGLGGPKDRFFEVGLHLLPDEDPGLIQKAFVKFAQQEGVQVHSEVDFVAGNLWFVPVEGKPSDVEKLASFSFVRVIRPVPKLRGIRPLLCVAYRSAGCSGLHQGWPRSRLPPQRREDQGRQEQRGHQGLLRPGEVCHRAGTPLGPGQVGNRAARGQDLPQFQPQESRVRHPLQRPRRRPPGHWCREDPLRADPLGRGPKARRSLQRHPACLCQDPRADPAAGVLADPRSMTVEGQTHVQSRLTDKEETDAGTLEEQRIRTERRSRDRRRSRPV